MAKKTTKSKPRAPVRATAHSLEVRTQRIRSYLRRNGPLYARALVPDYAQHDWGLGNYGAWYLAQ